MTITLLFFASLRETLGTSRESFSLPQGVATAGQLRRHLASRSPAWQQALGEGRAVRIAINQVMADADAAIPDGAEIAFFPPVTGG